MTEEIKELIKKAETAFINDEQSMALSLLAIAKILAIALEKEE